MHRLIFYEPAHFHAALTLRRPTPRVSPTVELYAVPGPDRDAFLALVDSFNARPDRPTAWQVVVHEGDDPGELLARLVRERRGDAVVLAGRNDRKLSVIAALHAAGLPVLADKPWLVDAGALDDLERVTAGGALAMDVMTGRFEPMARVRRALALDRDVFGDFATDGAPAIELGSVHHLLKVVNGAPLRRPPWYYDVRVQGDGIVDVQSHMTDQVQWLLDRPGDEQRSGAARVLSARRWRTPVPLALYRESTGLTRFDPELAPRVHEGVLGLACNGEIDYELGGVTVRQRAEWRLREPQGGGDLHHALLRGSRCELIVRQGPATGHRAELHVRPRSGIAVEAAVHAALRRCQPELPGVDAVPSDLGLEVRIPPALRSGHEAHFAMVLETFLDHLDAGGGAAALAARIRTRYALLAEAQRRCVDVEPPGEGWP